jgi:hypothetical protein
MKNTRRDPEGTFTRSALEALQHAYNLRSKRAERVTALYHQHGALTPLTSGCEQTHFPEDEKDWLRANARYIAETVDYAIARWKSAGRRLDTLRPFIQQARHEGSRY